MCQRHFAKALDIGCGEGFLRICGIKDVVGVDLLEGASVSVIASVEHLPFKQGTFDLIFAGEVIEHTRDPSKVIGEWASTLNPRGVLIVSTPNGLLIAASDNPQHQRTLRYQELVEISGRRGLRVVQKKGIFTGLISGRKLLRMIPFESIKHMIMRIPVPVSLSYDYFVVLETGTP